MTHHLFVSISAHGFGHAAQTAVVVNALWDRRPDLRVTIKSTLPRTLLAEFFAHDFALIDGSDDVGMVMSSPLDVVVDETAAAYQRFHAQWDDRVRRYAGELARLAPDLVLANVPYLPLAAATCAGIPAVGMSSLNWAELYWAFCGHRAEAAVIHAQMVEAYRRASLFLLPEPSMPMPWLPQRRTIGTLARVGVERRAELCRRLRIGDGQRLVLVAFGGIGGGRLFQDLPREPDIVWLLNSCTPSKRDDIASVSALAWPFPDLLCSVDAVVTKPGYGLVAESTCNGVRMLYVLRGDWIEEPFLVDWMQRHAVCREITAADLAQDGLVPALRALLAQRARTGPIAGGGAAAADVLAGYLS